MRLAQHRVVCKQAPRIIPAAICETASRAASSDAACIDTVGTLHHPFAAFLQFVPCVPDLDHAHDRRRHIAGKYTCKGTSCVYRKVFYTIIACSPHVFQRRTRSTVMATEEVPPSLGEDV